MHKLFNALLILLVATLCISCSKGTESTEKNNLVSANENIEISSKKNTRNESQQKPKYNYKQLRNSIAYGKATLLEVEQALTQTDVAQLSNTLHALYAMRWHRGVYHIYDDLWYLKKDKHPDFAWDALEKIPSRIALASTINRAKIYNSEEFKSYIRSHKNDEHEFHRAQVVVALGLNGDPDDVEYIKSMADSDNHYVTQSAISGLAMLNHVKARDAMVDLFQKYKDTPRGNLLLAMLKKSYNWVPVKTENKG